MARYGYSAYGRSRYLASCDAARAREITVERIIGGLKENRLAAIAALGGVMGRSCLRNEPRDFLFNQS
jgi:hypothetical protein